ncbi:MAG: ferredoxin [Pseudonocardiales bacterium]
MPSAGPAQRTQRRLQVDPIACDGIGVCAHLAADLIRVDSWGFPVITAIPLAGDDQRRARNAVAACPRRALFITEDPPI